MHTERGTPVGAIAERPPPATSNVEEEHDLTAGGDHTHTNCSAPSNFLVRFSLHARFRASEGSLPPAIR